MCGYGAGRRARDDWRRSLNVNLTGSFLCAQAAARVMVELGIAGRTINVGSINAVIPGPIGGDTMSRAMTADALDRAARGVPLGRLGGPDDIAAVVAFLVSPDAAWITGETVDVNGRVFID